MEWKNCSINFNGLIFSFFLFFNSKIDLYEITNLIDSTVMKFQFFFNILSRNTK